MQDHNPFDKAARYHFKLCPDELIPYLLGTSAKAVQFRYWLDARTIPLPGAPDHTCDCIARLDERAEHGRPWACIFEFKLSPEGDAFAQVRLYEATVSLTEKPDNEVGSRYYVTSAIVNLTSKQVSPPSEKLTSSNLQTPSNSAVVNLSERDAVQELKRIELGELGLPISPLIPLMQKGGEPSTIEAWKRLVDREPNARLRADYAVLALTFAEAAQRLAQWETGLKGWNMIESKVANRWIDLGRLEGLERGQLLGRICELQELLGDSEPHLAALQAMTVEELTTLHKQLKLRFTSRRNGSHD